MLNKCKKNIFLMIIILLVVMLTGCQSKSTLLILNWGEYINDDVVLKFEEKYNCQVIVSIADSNELFYAKVKSGTTKYDLVVPSDYMIQKMYDKNMLEKLDFSYIPNYSKDKFLPGVKGIMEQMFSENEKYHVPYFWGTFGLMYNKRKSGLEEAIQNNGWEAYFNDELLPKGTSVGMYNVPRFSYAASLLSLNKSPNLIDDISFEEAKTRLASRKYVSWGTDELKKKIEAGNLDLAFVYTGDCLDMLYEKLDNGTKINDITFDIYIPNSTIAFMDSLVMPKNARHKSLAYTFINFMLEPENAYENASVVGYCTPLIESYNMIANYIGDDNWLTSWAYAMSKYYPLPNENDPVQYKGTPLTNFTKNFLTKVTNMVNNVKADQN